MSAFPARAARWCAVAMAGASALMLAGCIDSTEPILTDGKSLLGLQPRFQIYSLRNGAANSSALATFKWNGSRYVGKMGADAMTFTLHEFEGHDFILQNFPTKNDATYEYALVRKLAEATYLVVTIEENDADEATRARFCRKGRTSCRIDSREALLTFAKAVAAKPRETGGLAVLLAGGPAEQPSPQATPKPASPQTAPKQSGAQAAPKQPAQSSKPAAKPPSGNTTPAPAEAPKRQSP